MTGPRHDPAFGDVDDDDAVTADDADDDQVTGPAPSELDQRKGTP